MRTSMGSLPSMICWRISGTHLGQSESVVRGQPSGGLDFWYDFSSGLSDHLGVNEGFWLMLLTLSNTAHAPLAATVTAFSTYLIGLCIYASGKKWWRPTPHRQAKFRTLQQLQTTGRWQCVQRRWAKREELALQRRYRTSNGELGHRAMLLKKKVQCEKFEWENTWSSCA